MKFIVDAQLPVALAKYIRLKGHGATHVADLQMLSDNDITIWQRAALNQEIIFTKDEDFAVRRLLLTSLHPQVVWCRVGNCSNDALIKWIEPMWDQIVERLGAGEFLVELV